MSKDRNIDQILNQFYKNYNEKDRLSRDHVHQLEYITTTHFIDQYLKADSRILEVGAGTGAYSLYYANQGYQVDAIELVEDNLEVLKSNITPNMNINAVQGNALDLSRYEDNTFDMTLVLGPLYHLFKEDEIDQAIKEAMRVTKKDGIIYIAFILFDLTMLTWGFTYGNIISNFGDDKMVDTKYRPINQENFIFNMMYIHEVKDLMSRYPLQHLHTVATDGVGRVFEEKLNQFDEETYQHFINYHLSICEREDLMGYSGHILYIAKK